MSLSLDGAGLVHPNGHRALHSVSLSLASGGRAAVVGPSGAGKTTLIRVLGTALRPTGGRVDVLGADPWQLGTGALRALRARIGVVHQNPPIPPRLRVVTAVLAGRLGALVAAIVVLWPLLVLAEFRPAALFESAHLQVMADFLRGFLPPSTCLLYTSPSPRD